VLGLARFTELDERYAFAQIATVLEIAVAAGELRVDDPRVTVPLAARAGRFGGLRPELAPHRCWLAFRWPRMSASGK
jgi:hypothetical protein